MTMVGFDPTIFIARKVMSTTQRNRTAVTATFVTHLVACVHIKGDVDMAAEPISHG
jgi:hypothetical protein